VTIDTYRIAAVEQLRTFAQIIDVPLEVAATPAELKQAIRRLRDRELIKDLYRRYAYGVDSVSLLELVVGVEEEFGVTIPDEDFDIKHFQSVASLAAFVRARLV
jgi:acyl carrier protein